MSTHTHFELEARALLMRLGQVRPFSSQIPMLAQASASADAQQKIDGLLLEGKKQMKGKIKSFIQNKARNARLDIARKQLDFALLKIQFNQLLDKLDIFADALTQRSEQRTGIWLAGMDALAEDALLPTEDLFTPPPLLCYLDRGHGAAIRRARTRLPGGGFNPVAVIRVPRERMVSSGIAASLIHEVGHQGAALLNLNHSLRQSLREHPLYQLDAWKLFDRWISEIVSDFWAVASLGITSTQGLIGVVSLPSYFVFRMNLDDPHPFPWIRVMLSAEIGKAFYPDPQWEKLILKWKQLYPLEKLSSEQQDQIYQLMDLLPTFAQLLLSHRSERLGNVKLRDIFPWKNRQPKKLRKLYEHWLKNPAQAESASPTLFFAVIGQARSDKKLSPEKEHQWLHAMLYQWALHRSLQN